MQLYTAFWALRADRPPERLRLRRYLHDFLAMVTVLPFGLPEAQSAARISARLEAAGKPIGTYEVLIVVTAMVNALTLVTRNILELSWIAGLQVENWY